MAEKNISFKIKVDTKQPVKSINYLEDELKDLKYAIKDVDPNSKQFKNISKGIKNTNKELDKLNNKFTGSKGLPAGVKSLGVAAAAAFSIGAITRFGKETLKAYDQQAKAEKTLLVALKGRQDATNSLVKQAQELQKTTLFGDEETIKAQALIAAFVKEEEQIKEVIPLVQDLAAAKGMDLAGAADLVSKTLGSSTNALSRYGIEVEGAVGSQERLTSLTSGLSKAFKGQAAAAAEAGTGPLKQLSNIFGDLKETIGGLLADSILPLAKGLSGLVSGFDKLIKQPYSKKLEEERIESQLLLKAISSLNEGSGERNRLIEELNKEYPGLLGNLKIEELTNSEINTILKDVNSEYLKRIELAVNAEEIEKNIDKTTKAYKEQKDAIKLVTELYEKNIKNADENATFEEKLAAIKEKGYKNQKAIEDSYDATGVAVDRLYTAYLNYSNITEELNKLLEEGADLTKTKIDIENEEASNREKLKTLTYEELNAKLKLSDAELKSQGIIRKSVEAVIEKREEEIDYYNKLTNSALKYGDVLTEKQKEEIKTIEAKQKAADELNKEQIKKDEELRETQVKRAKEAYNKTLEGSIKIFNEELENYKKLLNQKLISQEEYNAVVDNLISERSKKSIKEIDEDLKLYIELLNSKKISTEEYNQAIKILLDERLKLIEKEEKEKKEKSLEEEKEYRDEIINIIKNGLDEEKQEKINSINKNIEIAEKEREKLLENKNLTDEEIKSINDNTNDYIKQQNKEKNDILLTDNEKYIEELKKDIIDGNFNILSEDQKTFDLRRKEIDDYYEHLKSKITEGFTSELNLGSEFFDNKEFSFDLFEASEQFKNFTDKQLEIYNKYKQSVKDVDQKHKEEKEVIDEEELNDFNEKLQKKLEIVFKVAQAISSVWSGINNLKNAQDQEELNRIEELNKNRKDDLKNSLDSNLITQKEYDKRVAALDDSMDKKRKEIQRKQAKREKAKSIFDVIINTAVNIAESFPNPFLMALAGAVGAAQLAIIAATPIPSFKEGGKVETGGKLKGPSHKEGGIPIEAEGGEYIIKKSVVKKPGIEQILDQINSYENGGLVYTNKPISSDVFNEKNIKNISYLTENNIIEKQVKSIDIVKLSNDQIKTIIDGINNKKVYVVESELREVQNKVSVIEQNSII